jgi:DNA-directed RNA polymerase sigma subunit (sigma70/sigma32)
MKLKLIGIEEKQLKDYIVVTSKIRDISHEKMTVMAEKLLKDGAKIDKDGIRRLLIETNLKLVIKIAARYRGAGLTFAALIVAGNSGLIKAVRKYNGEETRGFLEHVSWSIEGVIIDALIEAKREA